MNVINYLSRFEYKILYLLKFYMIVCLDYKIITIYLDMYLF